MKRNIDLERRLQEAQKQRLCVWGNTAAQRRSLACRTQAGELSCVYKGLFVNPEYWNALDRTEQYKHIIRSLAVRHPKWVFCEMTAAVFYGVNESTRHMRLVNIAVKRNTYQHDYGLVRHHYMNEVQYELVDGVQVTPMKRTIFDCMRKCDFPDALAIGEAVLRRRLVGKRELRDYCVQRQGRGKVNALRALDYSTGRTENGGEAYALGVILDSGLAQPSLQEEITYPFDLAHRDRVDFAWRTSEGRLIVAELDGRVKYRDPTMFRDGDLSATIIAEKEREERIRLVADEVVRFSFREAMERQPLIRKLIHAGVPMSGAR